MDRKLLPLTASLFLNESHALHRNRKPCRLPPSLLFLCAQCFHCSLLLQPSLLAKGGGGGEKNVPTYFFCCKKECKPTYKWHEKDAVDDQLVNTHPSPFHGNV